MKHAAKMAIEEACKFAPSLMPNPVCRTLARTRRGVGIASIGNVIGHARRFQGNAGGTWQKLTTKRSGRFQPKPAAFTLRSSGFSP